MKFLFRMMIACFVVMAAHAQDADEPAELTRLREQFRLRVERELEPIRKIYRRELEKLQENMVRQDRLADALTVKNERAKQEPLKTPEQEEEGGGKPGSAAELKDWLVGSTWLARENTSKTSAEKGMVYLGPEGQAIISGSPVGKWEATSARSFYYQSKVWSGTVQVTLKGDLRSGTALAVKTLRYIQRVD